MTTLTLKEIEKRVIRKVNQYQPEINQVTSRIQSQNLNRGRVRPKDPTEETILARFTRK